MSPRLLIPLALSFLLPLQIDAQVVRGQLLNGETGLPLEGAMVLLQGAQGEVGAVLSNASGRFLLRAPSPGSYTVRADRIGHASTTSDPLTLALGDTVDIRLVAEVSAIQLEGLEVSGEARCDVRPEAGRAVATVWEEARKALAAAAHTEESGFYRYRTIRFLRELDITGRRVVSEQRRASQGYLLSPFESLPAETLISQGFIKADPGGDLYYAPDAHVLLSDPFLDTHCLGLTTGQGEAGGLLGVAFEPIGGRVLPDIRGVVWVEPTSGELRHVDYTYENLDPALRNDAVGGRVVFQGLPNGTWIVTEWRIRMPNAALAPDYRGGRQLILVGIREVGGEVDRVQDQRGETILEAERATLMGVVLDSTGVAPLSGATVVVVGTQATAVTDAEGSFRIPGLSEGVYAVRFSHPALPDLGGGPREAEVTLTPGKVSSLRIVAPPLSEVLAAACGEEDRPEGSAVLTGLVLDGETGAPLAGAIVRVLWTDYRFRGTNVAGASGGRWQTLLGIQDDGLQGQSDASGRYLACAVPGDYPLRVEGEAGGLTSGILATRIPEGEALFSQDITVVRSGSGSLVGLVVDWESGEPLEGVAVTLSTSEVERLTNEDGHFRFDDIPLGRHLLRANILGRNSFTDTIQIRPDRPLQLELRLPTQVLEVEGISVEVISQREMEFRQEGFSGARLDRVTPERMDELRDRVSNIVDIMRSMGSPRLRITENTSQGFPMGFCIQWARRRPSLAEITDTGGGCRSMLVILDGQPVQDAGGAGPTIPATEFLLDMDPEEIEEVTILSPIQGEFRYGRSGRYGALVIRTRRGVRDGG